MNTSSQAIEEIEALPAAREEEDYPGWGSPDLGQEMGLIERRGGKMGSSGWVFPDGSLLFGEWVKDPNPNPQYAYPPKAWVWHAAAHAPQGPGRIAPPNNIGLSRMAAWTDMDRSAPLRDQLTKAGHAYTEHALPHIVGMGGSAALICYTSPKSGRPMTILATPHQADIDAFGETYYYFEGMGEADALAIGEDGWGNRYDQIVALEHLCRGLLPVDRKDIICSSRPRKRD